MLTKPPYPTSVKPAETYNARAGDEYEQFVDVTNKNLREKVRHVRLMDRITRDGCTSIGTIQGCCRIIRKPWLNHGYNKGRSYLKDYGSGRGIERQSDVQVGPKTSDYVAVKPY